MPAIAPTLLALDFDGVLCDGLVEYFLSAWNTYCQMLAPDARKLAADASALGLMDVSISPPPELPPRFYRLRPAIETGWEMPVLIQALLSGRSDEEILQNWPDLAKQLAATAGIEQRLLGAKLDAIRDRWIERDLEGWLHCHRFYPGVLDRFQEIYKGGTNLFIVTTKEKRFAHQLLSREGVDFPIERIFGKDRRRPKYETLRELSTDSAEAPTVWFVEDRLRTLQLVERQPDLERVELFLVDWGYNTERDREIARNSDRLHLLSLSQFVGDFSTWL